MKKWTIPDGDNVYKEDLDFVMDTVEDEVEKRTKYQCAADRYGVMTGFTVTAGSGHVVVSSGYGITSSGKLVHLSTNTVVSTNAGNDNKWLYAVLTETDDTTSGHTHPETGTLNYHFEKYTVALSWLVTGGADAFKLCKQTDYSGGIPTLSKIPVTDRNEWSAKLGTEAVESDNIKNLAATKVNVENHAVVTAIGPSLESHVNALGSGTLSTCNAHAMSLEDLTDWQDDLSAKMGKCLSNGVFSPGGTAYRPLRGDIWDGVEQIEFAPPVGVERLMVSGKVFTSLNPYTGTWVGLPAATRTMATRFTFKTQTDPTQTSWTIGVGPCIRYVYVDTEGILQCQESLPATFVPVGSAGYNTTKLFLAKVTFGSNGNLEMSDFESSSYGSYGRGCDIRHMYMVAESTVAADNTEDSDQDPTDTNNPVPDYPTNPYQPIYNNMPFTVKSALNRIRNMIAKIVWGPNATPDYTWKTAFSSVTPNVLGLWPLTKKFSPKVDQGHFHTGVQGQGPNIAASNITATAPSTSLYSIASVQDYINKKGHATPNNYNPQGISQYDIYLPTKVAEYHSDSQPYPNGTPLSSLISSITPPYAIWVRFWVLNNSTENLTFDSRNMVIDYSWNLSLAGLATTPPHLPPSAGYSNFFSASQPGFRGLATLYITEASCSRWVEVQSLRSGDYMFKGTGSDAEVVSSTGAGLGPIITKGADGLWSFTWRLPIFTASSVAIKLNLAVIGLGGSISGF